MKVGILAQHIIQEARKTSERYLVAIAGPPGSGKSTLAEELQQHLEQAQPGQSVIVPMDGFHLDNRILDERGLRARKGAPETFDSEGFVTLIETLARSKDDVLIPAFDREQDAVVENADSVKGQQRILLIEGNYLFLNQSPWQRLADVCHVAVFLDPGMAILEERLVERWLHYGHDLESARQRALSNDIPNARYVRAHSNLEPYPIHYRIAG